MCGICGVLGNNLTTEKRLFKNLLYLSQWRGEHSTGVLSLKRDAIGKEGPIHTNVVKDGRASGTVLNDKESLINKEFEKSFLTGLIGHCRHATVGGIKVDNAHPFVFENVIGVHNGTIKKQFKGSRDYETDSQALYALIQNEGIEAALNEVDAFDTAYALVWYDNRDGKVRFIRNDQRPLLFSYIYGVTGLIFASEEWIIDTAVKAAKLNLKLGTHDLLERPDDMFTIGKNRLFTVDPSTPANYQIEDIKVVRKSFHSSSNYRSQRSSAYEAYYNSEFWDQYGVVENQTASEATGTGKDVDWLSRLQEEDKEAERRKKKEKKKTGDQVMVQGYKRLIAEHVFDKICNDGCCVCRNRIIVEPEDAIWFDDKHIVCADCAEAQWVQEYFKAEKAV